MLDGDPSAARTSSRLAVPGSTDAICFSLKLIPRLSTLAAQPLATTTTEPMAAKNANRRAVRCIKDGDFAIAFIEVHIWPRNGLTSTVTIINGQIPMLKAMFNMLGLFRPSDAAAAIYGASVAEARKEEYYSKLGVPDTVDGRFDMITLIVSLVLGRIGKIAKTAKNAESLGQEVFDIMFADMEQNLRAIGVSDEGMKYRIREMAGGFMGRMHTYGTLSENKDGIESKQLLEQWAQAVSRNVFRTDGDIAPTATELSHRVFAINLFLTSLDDGDIANGKISFPDF